MAELVDAQVSGTCDRFGRGSSSLLQGTIKKSPIRGFFCGYPEKTELPGGSLTTSESETGVSRSALADERSALEQSERWLLQGTTKTSPCRGFFISASHSHIFPVSLKNEANNKLPTARLESVRG